MHIVTDHVWSSEPCHGLTEGPVLRPGPGGSSTWRWVQQLFVIRGDAVAKYEQDFGPAEDFETVTPLMMPSLGDDTVAELQAYAEKNRHDDYWSRRSKEMLEASTLIQDAIRHLEIEREVLRNRSVLGPALNVQRNTVPIQFAKRAYRSKRDERRGYTTH